MLVDCKTGEPYVVPAVFEIELDAVRNLYASCFEEVIAEISAAGDSFGHGELQAEVEERFYSRLKLDGRIATWFRALLDQLLDSKQ